MISVIPKVSVCVVTFNHERYIGKCLQSILEQHVDFEYEIIVGDDCSTDGTRNIVEEYANRYPDKINAIFRNKNAGAAQNYIDVHSKARGLYIAQIDGDDYMLPEKLKLQNQFLDNNKECALVTHQSVLVSEDGTTIGVRNKVRPDISNTEYLLKNYIFFVNSSVMYRKQIRDGSSWMHTRPVIDFTICIEDSIRGDIGFINSPLVAYRHNPNSLTKVKGNALYNLTNLSIEGFVRAKDLGVDGKLCDYAMLKYILKSTVFYARKGDVQGCKLFLKKYNKIAKIHYGIIFASTVVTRLPFFAEFLTCFFAYGRRT